MGDYARGGSSPLSDTGLNYTRPGFDDDSAVSVVGDVDPHLGVDLRLVCRLRCGQGGGDVLKAGDEGLDVFSSEPCRGCSAELGFEPAAFLVGLGDALADR